MFGYIMFKKYERRELRETRGAKDVFEARAEIGVHDSLQYRDHPVFDYSDRSGDPDNNPAEYALVIIIIIIIILN